MPASRKKINTGRKRTYLKRVARAIRGNRNVVKTVTESNWVWALRLGKNKCQLFEKREMGRSGVQSRDDKGCCSQNRTTTLGKSDFGHKKKSYGGGGAKGKRRQK